MAALAFVASVRLELTTSAYNTASPSHGKVTRDSACNSAGKTTWANKSEIPLVQLRYIIGAAVPSDQ